MKNPDWAAFARLALAEDEAEHDVTTQLLQSASTRQGKGTFIAEAEFVLAGMPLVHAVFDVLGGASVESTGSNDGDVVRTGESFATVTGPASVLLGGERVALNYLQRLSGIATETRRAVDAVAGLGVDIVDTRKTTPGLRKLEKYAVRTAGGVNHRFSLKDAVLWKDNHWVLLESSGQSLADALRQAPDDLPVQVEIEREEQVREVADAGVRFVLLDNQTPATIARWSKILGPDVIIEASGGITTDRVREYAEAGVHRISMGSLTHSIQAAPISFQLTF